MPPAPRRRPAPPGAVLHGTALPVATLLVAGVLVAALLVALGPAAPGAAAGTAGPGGVSTLAAPAASHETGAMVPAAAPAPGLPGLPRTSAALAGVAVHGGDVAARWQAYQRVHDTARAALEGRAGLDRDAAAASAAGRRARFAMAGEAARREGAAARRAELDSVIGELAIALYVQGDPDASQAVLADPSPSVNDELARVVLAGASLEALLADRSEFARVERDAGRAAAGHADEVRAAAATSARTEAVRAPAEAEEGRTGAELAAARVDLERSRALGQVDGTDFSLVALDAYWQAAGRIALEQPACALRWWGLAGISRVEGHHGTFGRSRPDPDGTVSPPIVGIALDGSNSTRAIGDTDGGRLDGDARVDRAVGPMQFIPSTWARWGADGTGEGAADPHNLYDATLAAGRYLCAGRVGLDTDEGLRSGYFSYNRSLDYVERVLGFARAYQTRLELAGG